MSGDGDGKPGMGQTNDDIDPSLVKELTPSSLGSKQHWDAAYEEELEHYAADGVPGEDWFGPSIKSKIVRYLSKTPEISKDDSIIDLGCGCGPVLLELFEAGYTNLTGVDYSENAINLCSAVAKDNNMNIKLEVFDLVNGPVDNLGKFRVCIDKGTYDAISLIPTGSQTESRNKYLENVLRLLQDDGTFILASCNWTLTELEAHTNSLFAKQGDIPTTKFSFGGSSGNDVAIIILNKQR